MKKIILSLALLCINLISRAQVSTFAGNGIAGKTDGPAASAQFDHPNGIAFDKAGNMYVSDWSNHVIRKINTAGIVSTFAGTGVAGYQDGPATSAQFFEPWGLAIDASDNIYVGDAKNNRIRKITPTGIVSTLAGSGGAGFADGAGAMAMFYYPSAVGVDAAGNVYVGDGNNHRIRKITPSGVVSTLAGTGVSGLADGAVTSASFNVPNCMAVSPSGDVYVTDVWNHAIRKISGGVVSTLAGGSIGSSDGKGALASFNNPHGIFLDADGNLFVADTENNRIRKIAPDGTVTTVTGSAYGYLDGSFAVSLFRKPKCLAADKKGNLYVSDELNSRIRKLIGVTTGIRHNELSASAIYPNPAQNFLTINCKVSEKSALLSVYNLLGQTVIEKSFATPNLSLNEQIDLSGMHPGSYWIRIQSGSYTGMAPFVKL